MSYSGLDKTCIKCTKKIANNSDKHIQCCRCSFFLHHRCLGLRYTDYVNENKNLHANIVLNIHASVVTDMSMMDKMISTVMVVTSRSIEHVQVWVEKNMEIYKNIVLVNHATVDLVWRIFSHSSIFPTIK